MLLLSVAALLLATDPATPGAATATPAAPAAVAEQPVEAKPAPSKLICRREKPVGSNRPEKRCYTREQLDEANAASQRMYERKDRRVQTPEIGI